MRKPQAAPELLTQQPGGGRRQIPIASWKIRLCHVCSVFTLPPRDAMRKEFATQLLTTVDRVRRHLVVGPEEFCVIEAGCSCVISGSGHLEEIIP